MSGSDRGSQCANTPTVGSSTCMQSPPIGQLAQASADPTEPQFDAQRLRPKRHRTGAQIGGHTQGICALVTERTLSRHMPCGWESLLRLRGRLLGSAPASDPCAPVTRFWVRPGEGKRNPRMVTRQARQRASPLIKNSGAAGRAGRGLTLPGALAVAAAVAACRTCDGASSPRTGQVLLPVLRSRPGRVPLSILAVRIRVARR
jgi:hypothetical protein